MPLKLRHTHLLVILQINIDTIVGGRGRALRACTGKDPLRGILSSTLGFTTMRARVYTVHTDFERCVRNKRDT